MRESKNYNSSYACSKQHNNNNNNDKNCTYTHDVFPFRNYKINLLSSETGLKKRKVSHFALKQKKKKKLENNL